MKSLRRNINAILALINNPKRKGTRHLIRTAADLTATGCTVLYARIIPNLLIEIDPPAEAVLPSLGNIAMMSSDKRGEIIYSALRGPVRIQWRTPDLTTAKRGRDLYPPREHGRFKRQGRATA